MVFQNKVREGVLGGQKDRQTVIGGGGKGRKGREVGGKEGRK